MLGAVIPPLILTMAIIVATAIYCGDTTDCSWGLEFLFFFPLVAICALTSGPLVLYRALRRKGDPLRAATTAWTVLLAVPAVPLTLFVPMAVAWFPPLLGRHLALRRHPELRRRPWRHLRRRR